MPRVLTDWITAYMMHTEHSEAPEIFHFWTAVSTISGALRRKVWIDMGYFKWYVNFFTIFVAPPGIVAKSTTVDIGMSLLRELDYIRFGPSSSSWQAFISFLAESKEEVLHPSGEYIPMCAVTVVASELGTFFDPNNREQRDVLTDLWDCKPIPWVKLTKKDGKETVANPWVNLVGCTTPSWVAENLSDYFTGGGLASRIIFIYAEKKRKLVPYPQLLIPEEFPEQREVLTHDLREISKLCGEFTITESAFQWGKAWSEKHSMMSYPHLSAERFEHYLARKQTHMHKLAMILSASRSDELVIDKSDLSRANDYLTEMEQTLPAVFGQMNREQEVVIAADVLDQIRTLSVIPRSELFRDYFFRTMSWDTFEKVLRSLIASQLVKQGNEGGVIVIRPVYNRKSDNATQNSN